MGNFAIRMNRVWAIGRDTYLRVYPNPGIGVKISSSRRIAISWYGGVEWFQWRGDRWVRTWSFLSRVKRPGGV